MSAIVIDKYEGAGNDFLVLVEDAELGSDASFVVQLCDRHRGVGADGLIVISPLGTDGDAISMALWNADGSPAETSGNGVRCAIVAAIDHGLVDGPKVDVDTAGGRARGVVVARADGVSHVRVDMGTMRIDPVLASPVEAAAAFAVNVGNPHLVLLGARSTDEEVVKLGATLERAVPGGQNVEFATVLDEGRMTLVTFERGVGLTLSCGTGSCASAGAARAAGLVGDRVDVENPGGTLSVELRGPLEEPRVFLVGSARHVLNATFEASTTGDRARS